MVLLLCLTVARAEDLTLTFCDNFSGGLGNWDSTNFQAGEYPGGEYGLSAVSPITDTADLRRWFDDIEGWVVVRYAYFGGSYIGAPDSLGGTIGLRFGDSTGASVKSFAILSNIYPVDFFGKGCTVHRFEQKSGFVAFHADPPAQTLFSMDEVGVYRLNDSCVVDSAAYMHDIVVKKEQLSPDDPYYRVVYRDIPLSGPFLIVHLAVEGETQRPRWFTVNDTQIAIMDNDCQFWDYDEVSYAWRPDTDAVTLAFYGVEDSVAFTAEQLTLFCLDEIYEPTCEANTVQPPSRAAKCRTPGGATARVQVFDIQGRCIPSRGRHSPRTPGVYLQSSPDGRRARVIAVDRR